MNYTFEQIRNHYLVEKVVIRRDLYKTYKVVLKCGEYIEETFLKDVSNILKFLEGADKHETIS